MPRPSRTAIATLLTLAGCTVGPNFVPPRAPKATTWHRASPTDTAIATTDPDPRWWRAFNDPLLDTLVNQAVRQNLDLQQAVLRVVESRQNVATARAAGLPSLNATGSYMREQLGLKGLLESRGVYQQLNSLADQSSPINQISPGLGSDISAAGNGVLNQITSPINLFQYGLDASWELDLFGRVRRSVEQAKATSEAQLDATNDAMVMLEAEVAQTYVQMRTAQALAASQQQNLRTDQDALDLTQRRQRQGLTTDLDVDQARTQLETDAQQLPGYEKQQQQAVDQLNILLGQPPGTIDTALATPGPLLTPPPVVGIGLPSTLARRRPDIREAEAQLHAATASVGVAVANFYPDVSLTGNLGIRATDASYLTNWASHFYSVGPSISLPIFQGGRLTAGLRLARAEQAEAALHYRGTVLNALREVEDGLVAYRTDRAESDRIAQTLATATDTAYLADSRYRNGLADFIQLLDAQRNVVSARQQLIQADMQLATDVVALYRAVGGGWQEEGQGSALDPLGAAPPDPHSLESVAAPRTPMECGSGGAAPSGSRAEPWPSFRPRTALLGATALTAATWLALAPAAAQPASSAHPIGGQVTVGAATIANTPGTTTIDQSTGRAAIDWQSFDVGSAQTVNFVQPGSSSVTLNRVVGPDPSAIAGHINANGQIIITNPSGVVFDKGAQVNAQSLVVSTAGIRNANFAAGRLQLDQPGHASAAIANQGTITVAQAGLAALVAPSVANSGVINARLGHVVLAGAQAATLDMYGDGLVSIDVSGEVTQVQAGGRTATALVTNTGTILADGGTVQLTAAAADGVVQTLVDAGGKVQADTAGGQVGRVAITGTGGSLIVDGVVTAEGTAAGQTGGQIQVAASGSNTITGTLSASGQAGGGAIAIGTSLARPIGSGSFGPGTSARTLIAKSARIAADATAHGNGGRVTLLSTQQTSVAGTLSARGGALGGNGGTLELSGQTGFSLGGTADTSAPRGRLGTIVIDPTDLTIVGAGGTTDIALGTTTPNIGYAEAPAEATVTAADIEALTGAIDLQAVDDLTVAASLTLGSTQNLTLQAGNNLTVASGVVLSAGGAITLNAADSAIPGFNSAGALLIDGVVRSPSGVALNAGTGGITIGGTVDTSAGSFALIAISTGTLALLDGKVNTAAAALVAEGGALSETAGSIIIAGTLQPVGTDITLTGQNQIGTIGFFSTPGNLSLDDNESLVATGNSVSGGATSISVTGNLTIQGTLTAGTALSLSATRPPGGGGGTIAIDGSVAAANAQLSADDDIVLTGALTLPSTGTASFAAGGTISEPGSLAADILTGTAATAAFSGSNTLATLGSFTTTGRFQLSDLDALTITGPLEANGVSLSLAGNLLIAGNITTTGEGGTLDIVAAGSILQQGGSIVAPTLTGSANGARFATPSNVVLDLGPFDSEANFLLNDSIGVFVAGTVSVASGGLLTLIDDAPTLSSTGQLRAPGGTVALQEHTAGAGIALDGDSVPDNSVVAATLQIGSLTGGPVTVSGSLVLPGIATLDLLSGGAVTEAPGTETTAGLIQVGTLEGHAASATLDGANAIATLGSFTTTGGFSLVDGASFRDQPLAVTGPLSDATEIDLFDFGAITLSGTLAAPIIKADTSLVSGGSFALAAITQTGGLLSGGTIELASGTSLTQQAGAIVATGSAALTSDGPLAIGGTISGQTVTLTAFSTGGGGVEGPAHTPDSERPMSIGVITEPGGIITANTLDGQSATSATLADANVIGTLGLFFSNTGLTLSDAGALVVAGPLVDPSRIALATGGPLQFAGDVTTGELTLAAAGAVTQSGGTLQLGTLDGTAAGITLGGADNDIASLGSFASSGDLLLNDATPATLDGIVSVAAGGRLTLMDDSFDLSGGGMLSAPGGTVALQEHTAGAGIDLDGAAIPDGSVAATTLQIGSLGGGPVMLTGTLSLPGVAVLDLLSAGAIGDPGSIMVATLEGQGASAALNGINGIGTLGSFITTNGFSLTDGAPDGPTPLTLAGTVTDATGITLIDYGPLTLAGTLAAPTLTIAAHLEDVDGFDPDGTITQTGGRLSGGAITLTADDGLVQQAGAIAATGSVSLLSHGLLSLGGSLSAPSVTLTAATQPATDPPASGLITETGGTIAAGTLTGASDTTVALGGANTITTLGGFSSAGGFALTDTAPLTVAGPLTDATSVSLTTGSTLAFAGTVTTALLSLHALGAVTQPGGALQLGTLTGSAAGITLGAAANTIATLGAFTSSGSFLVEDADPVGVAGMVSAAPGATLTLIDDQVNFTAGGTLAAPAGTVVLEGYTPGTTIVLGTGGLSATSPVVAGTLRVIAPTTGGITIDGSFALAGVGTLDLIGGGALSETAGSALDVATLEGQTGSASLTGDNRIATLGPFTTQDAFSLADGQALTLGGTLSASAATLSVTGNLTLADAIATPGALTLIATGSIAQVGGGIAAGTLTGSAAGASFAGAGLNTIGTLAGFASTGDFRLDDAAPVSIAGTVSVATGGQLTLLDDAPSFTAAGQLSAPQGIVVLQDHTPGGGFLLSATTAPADAVIADTLQIGSSLDGPITIAGSFALANVATLDLRSAGAITESSGSAVDIATLQGSAASVDLGGANQIATLAGFTTTGSFALTDATALTLSGPLSAATASLATVGDLALDAIVTVPGVLSLTAGTISQTGALAVGTLSGAATTLQLGNAANAIATLADLTATGAVTLADATPLTLAGTITSGAMSLTAPAVTFTGSLAVPTLDLAVTDAALQTAGLLSLGTLSGTAGDLDLGSTGTTTLATLAHFTATGALQIADAAGLTVTGPIAAPGFAISALGSLTLAGGTFSAAPPAGSRGTTAPTGGTLQASGAITQTGTTGFASLGTAPATLTLALTNGGSIALADLQAQGQSIVFATGTGGRVSGQVAAGSVLVAGSGGAAALTGTIGSLTGSAAAAAAAITPAQNVAYLFDGCEIGVGCTTTGPTGPTAPGLDPGLLAAATPPTERPDIPAQYLVLTDSELLDPLTLTLREPNLFDTNDQDDATLLLPNISDRDY